VTQDPGGDEPGSAMSAAGTERSGRVGGLVRALVTAVVFLGAAWYTSVLQTPEFLGAVYWPSGIAVVALLVAPRREWWMILAGVAVAVPAVAALTGTAPVAAATWGAGTLVRSVIVAVLVERWSAARLDSTVRVLRFVVAVLIGSVASALLAAGIGVLTPLDDRLDVAQVGADWFTADALAIIVTVPVALVVLRRIPITRVWGAEGVSAITLVVGSCVVLNFVDDPHLAALLVLLVLLPAMWLAARFRVAGASIANFAVAHLLVVISVVGNGPFVGPQFGALDRAVLLRLFLFVLTIVALLLAARTVEVATYHDLAEYRATLLATVSHELRAPLNAVMGFAELLRTRADVSDEDRRRWVEAVEAGGRRMTRLVDDMLLLSRAERGGVTATPESVDLVEVVRRVLDERDDERLRADGAPHASAHADPAHVAQIVHNLVDNALRHGRPPVVVTVDREGDAVLVAVHDHGDGVPASLVDRVFQPFEQVGADGRGGLGLGLAICRELAVANGGEVALEPVDTGARFVLRLPVP
jgi:signal transduction histidine kinase